MGALRKFWTTAEPILLHGVATLVAIFVMWVTEGALNWALGHDAKFFDVVPVRYLIHAADLLIFVGFFVGIFVSIWKAYR